MTQHQGMPDEPADRDSLSPDLDQPSATDPPSRRWMPWIAAAAAVVLLIGTVSIVGLKVGPFGDSSAGDTRPGSLPSNSRALAAAVVAHIPAEVTVVWSSGHDDLGAGMPGNVPALKGSIIATVLMRSGSHEFYLSVLATPHGEGVSAAGLNESTPSRDKEGRVTSETVFASNGSSTLALMENAGPGGAGQLPLSESDLHEIATDPLVGPTTTRQMLIRSKNLTSYTTSPPPMSWDPFSW